MMRPKRTETQEVDALLTEDNDRGDNKKERGKGAAKRKLANLNGKNRTIS
jgi:hypothetical protein